MNYYFLIASTMFLSAFASGMEIAFISSNKLRIELDRKQGKFSASILSGFVKSPSRFIATMLIANNVALVIYGIPMEQLLEPYILNLLPAQFNTSLIVHFIQVFVSTVIILVAAEFIPKALFRINPNKVLTIFCIPVLVIYYLLLPLVFVVIGMSKFIMKSILKVEFTEEKPVFGKIDLDFYIREFTTSGNQEAEMQTEMRIFRNALDFTEVKVRECMIPRTEVVAMNADEPIEKLRDLFIKTKLSKILIYKDTIDNIIGFTHSFEIFKSPKDIMSILLPISIVPEVMPASELLNLFTEQHKSIALVVDEFGQTSGMVTIEDVMEEIFGEIHDEHDVDELIEKQTGEKEFLFSGRLEIDYLNDKYGLNIPSSDSYETLAGFIFQHHESMPSPKEQILISPFIITILQLKDRRIEQVKLKIE